MKDESYNAVPAKRTMDNERTGAGYIDAGDSTDIIGSVERANNSI
jgi:hypothetical protein